MNSRMNQKDVERSSRGKSLSAMTLKIIMPDAVPHITTTLDVATPTLLYAISAQGSRASQLAMRRRLASSDINIGRGKLQGYLTEYVIDQGYLMQTHAFINEIALIVNEDMMNGITVHAMIEDPSGAQWMLGIAMDKGDAEPLVLKSKTQN